MPNADRTFQPVWKPTAEQSTGIVDDGFLRGRLDRNVKNRRSPFRAYRRGRRLLAGVAAR
ncbi:hypothetical protein AB0420_12355 [Streptomyces caelestis]|nr:MULTISPECIES: hypothetical protein [Streptomyces]